MLFSSLDINSKNPDNATKADSLILEKNFTFVNGDKKRLLAEKIGVITLDNAIFFKTDGAWSVADLIGHILQQSGPAEINFATWSLGPEAIRAFNNWQETGMVKSVNCVIDEGFRNRKPDLFHQAKAAFKSLKFYKSHAKLVIIKSETHSITIMGSANLTRNPRTETGIIIWDEALADANIQWIMEGSGYE